jgi:hypothetical protein
MTPPLAVTAAAESFWADAGMEPTFPRDVRRAVARCQPISVVMMSALHVVKAEAWLRRQGMAIDMAVDDRPLRACLVAHGGAGIIFVDGADSEDEQRYSIAHELAHFFVDYLAPRHMAVARLGEGSLDVLDGRRPARGDERIVGILTDIQIRPHVHLMARFEDLTMSGDVARSESGADALALELLAPWDDVSQRCDAVGIGGERSAIARLLVDRYGLPRRPAERYAACFCPVSLPSSRLLRYLRHVELGSRPRNTEEDGMPFRKEQT